MEPEMPKKESSWVIPFSIHATRGLVRDPRVRRKVIGLSLVGSLAMLGAGLTLLQPWLNPHEHPWRFLFYWFVCGWVTLLMLLMALFDLLLVRAQARAAKKQMREAFITGSTVTSPDERGEG